MGAMGLSQHVLPTIAAALAAAAAGLLFGGVYFRALRIGVAVCGLAVAVRLGVSAYR